MAELQRGDGKTAEDVFRKARKSDDSGLSGLFLDLTDACLAYQPTDGTPALSRRVHELLGAVNRHFHHRPVPQAVLGEALKRIRGDLKQMPPGEAAPFLRPLLCNVRLLAGDRGTDGESVLEFTGTSRDVGALERPRGVFVPAPPYTEAARRAQGPELSGGRGGGGLGGLPGVGEIPQEAP